jgi:hypothetical protein
MKKQSERQRTETLSTKEQHMDYLLVRKTKISIENEKGYRKTHTHAQIHSHSLSETSKFNISAIRLAKIAFKSFRPFAPVTFPLQKFITNSKVIKKMFTKLYNL